MSGSLFRKQASEQLSTPEQLNDYIKVSSPSVWVTLCALIILLIGVCCWGIFGRLETIVNASVVSDGEQSVCYIPKRNAEDIGIGTKVIVGGEEYKISAITQSPHQAAGDDFSDNVLEAGDMQSGELVYTALLDDDLPSGVYSAEIIVESVSPMSFVFN